MVIIPFHGDDILTVDVNGEPNIVLKPALESIGVDYWTQVQKLRTRSWAVTRQRPVTGSDGKTYQMVTCDVQTFLMLLANIDENRVGVDVKPKLVVYQREVAQAIEDYWTKGKAVNPRVPKQPSRAEVALAMAQAVYDHELRLDRIDGEVAELGARVDGIEQRTGWFVALAYAKLHSLPCDKKSLQMLGKEAARIARRESVEPGRVPNEAYGFVNSYPEAIWKEAALVLKGRNQ